MCQSDGISGVQLETLSRVPYDLRPGSPHLELVYSACSSRSNQDSKHRALCELRVEAEVQFQVCQSLWHSARHLGRFLSSSSKVEDPSSCRDDVGIASCKLCNPICGCRISVPECNGDCAARGTERLPAP